jgi:uncharacterized protein (DUF433 family)
MSTASHSLPDSLHADADGVIRIGQSRVTLESLVAAFDAGASPEQFVLDFPTLDLADVYSAMGYLIRNRQSVDEYVAAGTAESEAFHASHPNLFAANVRERLIACQSGAKAQ